MGYIDINIEISEPQEKNQPVVRFRRRELEHYISDVSDIIKPQNDIIIPTSFPRIGHTLIIKEKIISRSFIYTLGQKRFHIMLTKISYT